MASVLRGGFTRFASPGISQRLCKVSQNHNVVQVALIRSRVSRLLAEPEPKPAPFPYWEKEFTLIKQAFDPTCSRFDENTKLITVDGLPTVGKAQFAKTLAEKLDMLYMPPPLAEDLYINPYGTDFRKYNKILPEGAQCVDLEIANTNPYHRNVPLFQWHMYHMRYEQYLNALLHILSTGQGVVLHRSVYSDRVFFYTMHKHGYISRQAFKTMRKIQHHAELMVWRPHLIIYLDASIDEVEANIKKRNIPYEVNSKIMTTQFLKDMESEYKEYLQDFSSHTYSVVYNWQSAKDVDWIIHDLERMNIDGNYERDKMLEDWDLEFPYQAVTMRIMCSEKTDLLNRLHPQNMEMPDEFYYSVDENAAVQEVIKDHETEEFDYGYHPYLDSKKHILLQGNNKLFPNSRFRRNCRDFLYLHETMKNFRKELQ